MILLLKLFGLELITLITDNLLYMIVFIQTKTLQF